MNHQLANFVTILSLLCGFSSVILSLSRSFAFSAYAVISAVVLDGLDGQLARKNGASGEFGKELDSLVDVVSFGVAPALLGYIFIYDNFHLLGVAALFIYLMCAVIRLAKYNITTKGGRHYYFNGLPTTAGGGVLASFILVCLEKNRFSLGLFISLVLLLAYLMVSKARYPDLDGLRQLSGRLFKPVVLSVFIILSYAFYRGKAGTALFSIFLIYLIFSPFMVKRLNSAKA